MLSQPFDRTCSRDFWVTTRGLNAFATGPLVIETVLWGVFSCLIVVLFYLWIRDTSPGIKKPLYTTMVCIAGLTYAIAAAHWGIAFAWMQKTLVSPSEQHALLQAIEIGGPCSLPVPSIEDLEGDDLYTMNLLPMPSCVETVLLTASIALSTSMVLLRVLLLWSKSFSLLVIVVVSLLTLLASSCWNALRTSSPCFSTDPALSCFFCDVPGIVVLCMSGALNVLPILFTGYKLWSLRLTLQRHFSKAILGAEIKLLGIVALLVDSGLPYCALWVALVIGRLGKSQQFSNIIATYLESTSLIHLVGIYPTVQAIIIFYERLQGHSGDGLGVLRTVYGLSYKNNAQL